MQIDFKHRLEKTHVGTLVQANLVFPDVDNKDFTGGEGKESALSLEILVFATLSSIRALYIHDKNIVGHGNASTLLALVLGHPNTLGCLSSFGFGHDGELGAKEVVQERGFTGRLGAKDRNEVIVEAGWRNMRLLQVVVEVGATACRAVSTGSAGIVVRQRNIG